MVRISFLGDISLNNRYNEVQAYNKDPFQRVSHKLKKADLVIGNLECISEGNEGENELKAPRLKTNIETLNLLKKIPVSIVTLAHNHIYDNLLNGYEKTKNFLKSNDIEQFGAGENEVEASIPLIKDIKGLKFCFLNYVTEDTNSNLPEKPKVVPNFFDQNRIIDDIKSFRERVDFVIVILHWGGKVENGLFPDWNQPKLSREFIDNGADLIVGHHTHTLQPFEIYKGKYIFYSLGNFCFSDITFEGKLYSKLSFRQKKSIILDIEFKEDEYKVSLVPIRNKNGSIIIRKPLFWRVYYGILNITFQVIRRNKFLWKLYFFKFNAINPVLNFLFTQRKSPLKLLSFKKIKKYIRNIFK